MKVLLRDATPYDLPLILAWRSIPDIYKWFFIQARENRVLTWKEHYAYWEAAKEQHLFIIGVENDWVRDVGFVNLSDLDSQKPKVSIAIGEVSLWGKGVGHKALKLGIEWLKRQRKEYVHTSILKKNDRSIKLFESCGFKRIGEARGGEWEYELRMEER